MTVYDALLTARNSVLVDIRSLEDIYAMGKPVLPAQAKGRYVVVHRPTTDLDVNGVRRQILNADDFAAKVPPLTDCARVFLASGIVLRSTAAGRFVEHVKEPLRRRRRRPPPPLPALPSPLPPRPSVA